jgi:two-component system response regulator
MPSGISYKKDGKEVLTAVKADDQLKVIPVVVLTTSGADKDILKVYRPHANRYATKPVAFRDSAETIQSVARFWLAVVTWPRG